MFSKVAILFAIVAGSCALTPGHIAYDGAYAQGAQSEHTVRGFAGLSSISKQAKAIHSPYSVSQKHDTRVTNDAAYGYAAPAYGYAAPAYGYAGAPLAHPAYAQHAYAAPVAHPAYAQHAYAAPAVAAPLGHHAYAAPLAHHGYAAPVAHHAYAAPVAHQAYAAPLAHHGYAAPIAKVGHGGLGVSFSPATAVATHTFSGFYGGIPLQYAY